MIERGRGECVNEESEWKQQVKKYFEEIKENLGNKGMRKGKIVVWEK